MYIELQEASAIIQDIHTDITKRFRALFEIRGMYSADAIKSLINAFRIEKESDLLKHEICYCLGQMNTNEENTSLIQEFYEKVINEDHSSIVIHEAVEGYANLNTDNIQKLLEKFKGVDDELIGETCELALELSKWNEETKQGETEGLDLKKLKHGTNDPSPPFNIEKEEKYRDVEWLKNLLLDPKAPIFDRYRAMFTLREVNTDESCEALCQTLVEEHSSDCTALLKHEIGFILGQMGHSFAKISTPYLEKAVQNEKEAPVVRHECVIALGDITDKTEVMERYSKEDQDPIVRESCLVALDMVNYWKE
jgi:deoxyhypusine monooxygenase